MNFIKKISKRLKKEVKYSASDPNTFKEVWSFNSNGIRVISLSLLFLVIFGALVVQLSKSKLVSGYLNQKDTSIEREKLEEQNELIEILSGKMESQERYISSLKLILLGEVPVSSSIDSLVLIADSVQELNLDDELTVEEKKMANKVKADMSTLSKKENTKAVQFFIAPVTGVISQAYLTDSHEGIDVVTEKNAVIKSCLDGRVIYAGYTHQDGNLLIVEHQEGIISVYKHCQRILKKAGVKVKIGDPIGIVGNTGENSDGPHLHFELWMEQQAVNPEEYIQFTR